MQRKHNPQLTPLARELRKSMTPEERKLWHEFLRQHPVKFYRQRVIGNYIIDFYCARAKLVVEIDGSQHFGPAGLEYDKERDAFLKSFGLDIIRIPNNEVHKNFRGVCELIDNAVMNAYPRETELQE